MKNIWDRVDFIANKISEKKRTVLKKIIPLKFLLKIMFTCQSLEQIEFQFLTLFSGALCLV